jgi:phage shock protein A
MGILDRIVALFRVKLRQRRDASEDPNAALDLSYEKMLTGLQETRRKLADAMAQQKLLERRLAAADPQSRAALQAALEDLAPQVEKLADYQRQLSDRIERFRIRKETVRVGAEAADAQADAIQSLTGLDSAFNRADDAYRRAEEKMLDARYKAAAMDRLARDGLLGDPLAERASSDGEKPAQPDVPPSAAPISGPARTAGRESE